MAQVTNLQDRREARRTPPSPRPAPQPRADGRVILDYDMALAGYLRSPKGELRFIHGLDRIAGDMEAADVRADWMTEDELLSKPLAVAYIWSRLIRLSPRLWDLDAWCVRRVLTHELGHCLGKGTEAKTKKWQRLVYGDLIVPDEEAP
jgi:hypothetical protein